jgi:hypothetical protein
MVLNHHCRVGHPPSAAVALPAMKKAVVVTVLPGGTSRPGLRGRRIDVATSAKAPAAVVPSSPSRQAAPPPGAPHPAHVDDGRFMGTPPAGDETRADIDVDGDGAIL